MRISTHRQKHHGQVSRQGRIGGLPYAIYVQIVPQLLLQREGPMQLQLQRVESSQLYVLCVCEVAAP